MLYNVKLEYGNGTVVEELISSPTPPTIYPKRDDIIHSMASVHKYEVEQLYPPILYISDISGKKYIMPSDIEVHPDTTIDDIIWTKPKLKKEIERVQGSMGMYKTTYDPNKKTYKCTCFGFYRARMKGGVCKHIKTLQTKMEAL